MRTPALIIITSLIGIAACNILLVSNTNTNQPSEKLPLYTNRCDTSDLTSYSVSIRDQIAYLCEQGFTKQDAISNLRIVLSNPSINPDQAYKIVLLGRKIANHDPLTRANH